MVKRMTQLYKLTMKVDDMEEFKKTYLDVFSKLSAWMKLDEPITPIQVILEEIVGFCQVSILRNPNVPEYRMSDFIFQLSGEMKSKYSMNSVIIEKSGVAVSEDRIPQSMKVNIKSVKELIKKAMEDEIFSEKYKEKGRLEDLSDDLEKMELQADRYAMSRMKSADIVMNNPGPKDDKDDTTDNKDEDKDGGNMSEIMYRLEKNGQLCLVSY